MPKKILLLTHCFPPYVFAESYLVVKRFSHVTDACVDVITTKAFYPWVKKDEKFMAYAQEKFAKITQITPPVWYKHLPFHQLSGIFSIPDAYVYLNPLYKKHLKNLDQYDAVVTWSMYHSIHLLGLFIKKRSPNLPWIAHFSDPWSTSPFAKKNRLLTKINAFLEKKVFLKADKLTFTSEETINNVLNNYPSFIRKKTLVIPHAYEEKLYQPTASKKSGKLIIRYLGAFYGERQPHTFLAALSLLANSYPEVFANVQIEFIGTVQPEIKIAPALSPYVSTQAPVDYLASLQLMKESDMLLVIDAPFENSPFLPSKLVDYIGADKPIFGITPTGTSQKLIEEMGFLVAHPNNVAEIAEKLLTMIIAVQNGKFEKIPYETRQRYSVAAVNQKITEILHETGR